MGEAGSVLHLLNLLKGDSVGRSRNKTHADYADLLDQFVLKFAILVVVVLPIGCPATLAKALQHALLHHVLDQLILRVPLRDVRDIVKYLHASHTFYLETAIVRISNDIARLIEPCSDKLQKVIWKFFSDYKDELGRHFQFEEANVLPYVQELLGEGVADDFCIEDFEENHSDVDAKLEDLKNLVMKALPPQCDVQLRTSLLSYLYYLRTDLRRHPLIEDKVLVPVVKRIETHKARNHQHRHEEDHSDELSEREKEILVSVARGFMNKEIADMHNISINTVITHRKNITRKTGIKTVAGLTVYALLNGLIDVNSVE